MWSARVIETTTIDGRGSQQETVAEIEPAISTIAGSLVSIGTISQTQPRYVSNICSAILYIFCKLKLLKKMFSLFTLYRGRTMLVTIRNTHR